MLKRLFLRKSQEILNEVQSAENMLKTAEERIEKLKSTSKFSLLRQEIIQLIQDSNYLSQNIMKHLNNHYNQWNGASEEQMKLNKVLTEINHCLNEMETLTKENQDAT